MEGFEKGKEVVLRGNFTPGYMMDFRWKKRGIENGNPGVRRQDSVKIQQPDSSVDVQN